MAKKKLTGIKKDNISVEKPVEKEKPDKVEDKDKPETIKPKKKKNQPEPVTFVSITPERMSRGLSQQIVRLPERTVRDEEMLITELYAQNIKHGKITKIVNFDLDKDKNFTTEFIIERKD